MIQRFHSVLTSRQMLGWLSRGFKAFQRDRLGGVEEDLPQRQRRSFSCRDQKTSLVFNLTSPPRTAPLAHCLALACHDCAHACTLALHCTPCAPKITNFMVHANAGTPIGHPAHECRKGEDEEHVYDVGVACVSWQMQCGRWKGRRME
ncbi:hypothetical protein AB1Y20_013761 [Prymnesium parvum]|uniref:Uncharacterized protein n=1 Tax=Prymnesium parvum TaxID=97485 RepID=A0AB34IK37_PRYPA